jgi:hypothetical protein
MEIKLRFKDDIYKTLVIFNLLDLVVTIKDLVPTMFVAFSSSSLD